MKRTRTYWWRQPGRKRIKVIFNPTPRALSCAIAKARGEPIPLQYDPVHLLYLAEEKWRATLKQQEKNLKKAAKDFRWHIIDHYDKKGIEISDEERRETWQEFKSRAMIIN